MDDRDEIERRKRQIKQHDLLRQWLDRENAVSGAALEELKAEGWKPGSGPTKPIRPAAETRPEPRRRGPSGPTLAEIEGERRRLAADGQAHGYDSLSGATGPFPGQRALIRRRYKGMPPPGAPIEGICETVRDHAHPIDD